MLFGAAGQAVRLHSTMPILFPRLTLILEQMSMAVLAGATSHTSTTTGIVAAVFLFVFNSFFAVGWLGMTSLYPGR